MASSLPSTAAADELALPVMRTDVRPKQQWVVSVMVAAEQRIAAAASVELQARRIWPRLQSWQPLGIWPAAASGECQQVVSIAYLSVRH